jgi:hypothetical protein
MMREDGKMTNAADAQQHQLLISATDREPAESKDIIDLISLSAKLLFENGQSTERTVSAAEQLAGRTGNRAIVFPRWDELTVTRCRKLLRLRAHSVTKARLCSVRKLGGWVVRACHANAAVRN